MSWLVKIDALQELEENKEWQAIFELLQGLWNNDKSNFNIQSRIATECWYILVEWDISIDCSDLDYEQFKKTLIHVTDSFLVQPNKRFKDLCLFGYIITLFPYLFFEGEVTGAYARWEKAGNDLLKEAYQLEKSNSIINIIYRGKDLDKVKYLFYKRIIKDSIDNYFTNQTMVERYFRDILLSA